MEELINTLKNQGIEDKAVLEAMGKVDRKDFVPPSFKHRAYMDIPISIGSGQTISQPTVVGLMTQELQIKSTHRVLEVGTGSGYQTMILSHLARHVYTTERIRSLHQKAKNLVLKKYKRENISFVYSDGALGLPDAAEFDRIIVTAASEEVPRNLMEQLKVNGIMVLPVVESEWQQRLVVVNKTEPEVEYKEVCAVRFVPLIEGIEDA